MKYLGTTIIKVKPYNDMTESGTIIREWVTLIITVKSPTSTATSRGFQVTQKMTMVFGYCFREIRTVGKRASRHFFPMEDCFLGGTHGKEEEKKLR